WGVVLVVCWLGGLGVLGGPWGAEEARRALFQLVGGGRSVVVTREAGSESVRAVLAPLAALAALSEEQRVAMGSWPAHGLTRARQALGALVTQAAGGVPQRLCRHGRDVAVLLPVDAVVSETSPASPAS